MKKNSGIIFVLCFFAIVTCQSNKPTEAEIPVLKDVFKDAFLVGTALSKNQIEGNDPQSILLTQKQFNTITPENMLKWERIHPQPQTYNFEPVDAFVEFGQKNKMFMVGHTLVWHSQTPGWVYQDHQGKDLSRDALMERLKDHIFTVVGRYKGKINGWDVVNEAFEDNGEWRQTKYFQIIGEDYIEHALRWTHEADPGAELYYNDYNMWHSGKVAVVVKMVKDLQEKGVPIDGIGMQGHWGMDYPPLDELDAALKAYSETGLKIMITEMDIKTLPEPGPDTGADISKNYELQARLNPYPDGLPDSMQTKLANRYEELFKMLLKYKDNISRVTFWGVHDGVSWCNNWPVRGRTDYPLLFDRQLKPKPAFYRLTGLMNHE